MDVHRAIGAVRELGEHALGLAEGVGEKDRRPAGGAHLVPPGTEFAHRPVRRIPAKQRQRKRRLRDEGMAPQRLERRTRRIRCPLVIARDHPHLTTLLDPNLRRTEDVTRRMERHANPVDVDGIAICNPGQRRIRAKAPLDQRPRCFGGEIGAAAGAQVVAVRVRDESTIDRRPGIDMEAAGGAIEAGRSRFY